MNEENYQEKKGIYRKQLFNSFYFALIGFGLCLSIVENIREMNKVSYFGYETYEVPRMLSWFFDNFGPVPTTIAMILLAILMEGYFVYRVIKYFKNMKELNLNFQENRIEESE